MNIRTHAGLCACFALLLTGCGHTQASGPVPPPHPAAASTPALKQAPPTPIDVKKEELGGKTWDPRWDAAVEQALPPSLLSPAAARAVRGYCPRFAREGEADKRAFWAYTFQALAGAEAGLDPTTTVHHLDPAVNIPDSVSGRQRRQEGLLQLTYEDERRYGCDFDWGRDRKLASKDPRRSILNPDKNLLCGIKIMDHQIIEQGKPLVTRTSYWATLKPGTAGHRVFTKQMANVPAACGLGVLEPRKHAQSAGSRAK